MITEQKPHYRVLARKYRPSHFGELVGQDALVRTLKNAIESGRIAHAYMLTGVRGVGKTTTARIIARALNYTGPDGKAGPTTGPTDDCETCRAIAADRHPDVMEMDAASRTGVDDIREILDGVRYAPSSARYKVYIIDEVHMLSKAAFNALLKTLEEPPPHVIFIFATTEIRRVPVTVLSRCQRFDLRRVDVQTLQDHYSKICALEKIEAEEEAISLIVRAADGSVRDGLSLLDQAIAQGSGEVTAGLVQDMMGLADASRILDLLESAVKGECAKALEIMEGLYRNGADPVVVIQDMLDLTHRMTRLRAVPQLKDMPQAAMARDTAERLASLSTALSMPALGRTWQILLKGLSELAYAPAPQAAAEMIVLRLSYIADLPDPADLLRKLKDHQPGKPPSMNPSPVAAAQTRQLETVSSAGGATARALSVEAPDPRYDIATMEDVDAVLRAHGHMILAGEVYQYVHPVKIEPGLLDVRMEEVARTSLSTDLMRVLTEITGVRWVVSISSAAGAPTLAEDRAMKDKKALADIEEHPVVSKVLALFPGTTVAFEKKIEGEQNR